jgi:hypothetical protein
MGAPRHHVVDEPEVWLGVQDASVMLGVSPATLRRWSAAGKVRAFTTPGGHRRYAESTIRQLLGRAARLDLSLDGLGESPERVAGLVHRHLSPMSAGISWLPTVSPDGRRVLAHAGTAMVEGLLRYVEGSTEHECTAAIGPALEAAALHGRLAAQHGGDLGETLEAFHRFRGVLVDDLADLACRHGLATPEATWILTRANDGVDRLIVALVEAYARTREPVASPSAR